VEAPVSGPQRKVVSWGVRPLRRALGDTGIVVRRGRSLPFEVTRAWLAPAGAYWEQFFLVDPATRTVLVEGPSQLRAIWGLQALTEIRDEVREPLELPTGVLLVVFGLGGVNGGEFEIEVVEAPAEEAA
jgi:hypothetical protein